MEIFENIREPYTWQQLKDFANSLSEDQLQKEVIVWGENSGGAVTMVHVLEEDYVNPNGEGCEPISAYLNDAVSEEELEELIVVVPKGEIRISIN